MALPVMVEAPFAVGVSVPPMGLLPLMLSVLVVAVAPLKFSVPPLMVRVVMLAATLKIGRASGREIVLMPYKAVMVVMNPLLDTEPAPLTPAVTVCVPPPTLIVAALVTV